MLLYSKVDDLTAVLWDILRSQMWNSVLLADNVLWVLWPVKVSVPVLFYPYTLIVLCCCYSCAVRSVFNGVAGDQISGLFL